MASSPMQRQKRISFFLGVITTLVVCGVIIAGLAYMLYRNMQAEKTRKAQLASVYVLNRDVLSGQIVSTDMFTRKELDKSTIPQNAINDMSTLSSYSLKDDKGRAVYVDKEGMYLLDDNDKKIRINTENDGTYTIEEDGDKEVIKLTEAPLIAKANMSANTVLTRDLLVQTDEISTDDARNQEYNMITLPSTLETGNFIDIRLRLPNGTDYIVISKKEVTIPDIGGIPSEDTIQVKLSEDEILTMSNAIVEAYIIKGSEIYAAVYSDPGNQSKSSSTYPVNREVMELINSDPNIVETAKNALYNRYNVDQRNGSVNGQLNANSEDAESNVEAGIQEQITRQKELRSKYLEGLNGSSN